jgi:hypothetical protein
VVYELKLYFLMQKSYFKKYKTSNEENQSNLKASVNDIQTSLNDLTKMDLVNRIPQLEDKFGKLSQELGKMETLISSLKDNDFKMLNEQIKKLEEQSNVTLPQQIAIETDRITSLKMEIDQLNNNALILASRTAATEELVHNLLPLPNKIKVLAEKCDKFEVDVASFKSLTESTIDANSEIVRRIEEMEEKFDGLDDIITSRMISIRDTLMETLLEKQLHTSINDASPVQMSVAAMADSVPVAAVVAKESFPTTAKLTKMSSNVGKIVLNTDSEHPPSRYNGGVSNVVALSKKEQSYRRPTISGAVITGSSLSSNNNVTGSVPSSASSIHINHSINASHATHIQSSYIPVSFHHQSHVPQPNLASMTDSFSTGSRTPRSHSNDEVHFENNHRESRPTASSAKHSSQRGIAETNTTNLEGLTFAMEDHHFVSSPRGGGFQFDDNLDTNGPPSPSNNNGNDGFFETPCLDGEGSQSQSIISEAPSQLTLQITRNTAFLTTSAISPKEIPTNLKPEGNYGPPVSSKKSASVASKKSQYKRFQTVSSSHPHTEKELSCNVGVTAAFPSSSSLSLGIFPSLHNEGSSSSIFLNPTVGGLDDGGEGILSLSHHNSSTDVSNGSFMFFSHCQFLSDLCFNYEEISMKKKRISTVPSIICHNLLRITQKLAEDIAHSSDYDMVEMILNKIIDENISSNISDIQYDEDYGIYVHTCLSHSFIYFSFFS